MQRRRGSTVVAVSVALATVLSLFVGGTVASSEITTDFNLNTAANDSGLGAPHGMDLVAVCDEGTLSPGEILDITFTEPVDGHPGEYRTVSVNSTRSMDFVVYRQGSQYYELDLEFAEDKQRGVFSVGEGYPASHRSEAYPCSYRAGVKRVPGGGIVDVNPNPDP